MAVPPEDMFAGPAPTPRRTSGKTPLSGAAPLPGLSDIRITPPSLPGGADLLPDIEAGGTSGGTAGGDAAFSVGAFEERGGAPVLLPMAMEEAADEAADAAAAAAGADEAATAQLQHAAARRRAVAAGPRRRRPTMDTGRDGRPATTLPSDEIRRLLADRKPLMTRRGLPSRRRGAPAPPGPFDVVSTEAGAAPVWLASRHLTGAWLCALPGGERAKRKPCGCPPALPLRNPARRARPHAQG